tara:strand:+ start:4882 stop:5217 length:336 start_codon:yes stop_codon:yes gene_type:complete
MVVKSQLTQNIKNNQNRYDTRQRRIKSIKEKLRKFGKPGQNMINHLVNRNSEFTNTNITELDNKKTVTGMVNVIKRVLKFENKSNKSNNNSNSGSTSSKSSPRNIPTRSRS